jgi:succinate dehydrogenase / fumarate reductase flavoprotein subunit
MHYQMGGIKTDVDGLTSVPGLYAAGEVACVSVHGGNRLGANSLLDTLVFGRRAGQHASDRSRDAAHPAVTEAAADGDRQVIADLLDGDGGGEMFGSIRGDLGRTMAVRLAVFRDQQGMEEALATFNELKDRYSRVTVVDKGKTFNTNLVFTLELGFMLDCAETIIMGALERKESRGAHTRTDLPERDDENWLKHVVLTKGPEVPSVTYEPVTITQWKPQARTY